MSGEIRVGIRGTGSALPPKVLRNADFEKMIDTTDEWITTRTGIKERRIVGDGETTATLATEAARRALDAAGMQPSDLDAIVVATVTPDNQFPSTACKVQAALGATRAGAFDISAACSGFLYGLNIGRSLIVARSARNVLVIGAETLSRIVDYTDRAACILFGDGAGAAILSHEFERGEVLPHRIYADGGGYEIMWLQAGGSAQRITPEAMAAGQHYLRIRGREVYKFAVSRFVELVQEQRAAHPGDALGLVIPHQVNLRIIESAREKLDIPMEQIFCNIEKYGNTSAASIGIALDEAVRTGAIDAARGKLVIFCAFGAGLTWASGALRW
ncbi:MAG: ketoacyl-ACP synthase III [Planctomycetes bacterium]|nr:ketoacyl-ACP synthase III [Planctomycetota bacterium]